MLLFFKVQNCQIQTTAEMPDILLLGKGEKFSRCAIHFDSNVINSLMKNMNLTVLSTRGKEINSKRGPPSPFGKKFTIICDHDKVFQS